MDKKQRILVVDDTPANIKILHDLLRMQYSISVATNGADALERAHSEISPDLILLDIMMPGMDGFEVCQRLKSAEETASIPIIFISARGDIEDETKGFEVGAIDYITKPFSPPIVTARVKTHLDLKLAHDHLEELVTERTQELEKAYSDLKSSHEQILHQEKLASIGQLAAGVAHEINNPIGYISSNLGSLNRYFIKLEEFHSKESAVFKLLDKHEINELNQLKKKLKIDFILEDTKDLIEESVEGIDRIKKIVMGLKNFSRKDQDDFCKANINNCLEDTLHIIWNELKYKVTLKKEFDDLPQISCYPQQLNQVFMNILINAGHAIEDQGTITIKTWEENDSIYVRISDTGCGIPQENIDKIFEAFFTTKGPGKGTGLGMSIVAEIIKKHNGKIKVKSEVGKGTEFTLSFPIVQ